MALPMALAAAGTLATAAYLDAKFLIGHDLATGSLATATAAALKYTMAQVAKDRLLTYHIFEDHALHPQRGSNTFLIFEGRTWTYRQFFADLQRVGNWLMNDLGIARDEMVVLDAENSAEYLMVWLALEGIGAPCAFLNCNLTNQPLVHCAKLCNTRLLIADRDMHAKVSPCDEELQGAGIQTVYFDADFLASLRDDSPLPVARRSGIKPDDIRTLIFTSGTTGLPKAMIINTARELNTGRAIGEYLALKPNESIMYTCMPLYHGAARALCVTPTIHSGSSVALGRKFSHRTFWPEVRACRAQTIQYVGELCRYLVNAPPSPLDKQHDVFMAWGNGMRADIWEVFRERFGIPVINELYAATDGLGACFNYNRGDFGKFAIAKRGLFWRLTSGRNEVRVKMDVVTEEILRDKKGFAIECGVNEPGEMLIRLDPATADARFQGYYQNKAATEKKKIRDVFEEGDLWLRSGDMMRMDADGCIYFVDRLGDTFRWKSENVSTNEVGDAVGQFKDVAEVCVYGVSVPHADGRAGCACLVPVAGVTAQSFDFEGLAARLTRTLPRYALPIFLRITPALQYTGTMKMQKGQLKQEGIDPDKIENSEGEGRGDKIYWMPSDGKSYVPFRRKDWEALQRGQVRL